MQNGLLKHIYKIRIVFKPFLARLKNSQNLIKVTKTQNCPLISNQLKKFQKSFYKKNDQQKVSNF